MHTFGQNPLKTYNKEWKAVEALVAKGLVKDALDEVKKIHQLATKEHQDAQQIKASLYRMQLQTENREDNAIESIRELEEEVNESNEPARSILKSLLADTYHHYYQTIRWKLYDRTETVNFDKADIATWGTQDFHRKIGTLYLESIHDEALLKQTSLEPYDAIITKGNVRHLRPTLFDLLAFEALGYFSSDEQNIQKPAYSFEINTASAFDPAADFIHRKFETKDSASLEYRALLLYQRLIAFHINDRKPDAFIDVDLARLQYVKEKSVHPDKNELYFTAVSHIADQYQSTPAAAQAWYLKAAALNENANRYQPGNDSLFRFERVKAIEICKCIVRENPDTEGGINAQNLMRIIMAKSLYCSVEMVNPINQPFRIFTRYKNVGTLHLRVIRLNEYLRKYLEEDRENAKWTVLTSAQAVQSWSQLLPDTKDHQEHIVEVKAEGLPSGEYVLLASSDAGFSKAEEALGATVFYVSDISYAQKGNDFFVLDRTSGQPLAGAKVQIWTKEYDYNTRSFVKNKGGLFTTDSNGHFQRLNVPEKQRNKQHFLEITFANDRLFLQQDTNPYFHREDDANTPNEQIHLFTDRSLYRPGQIVYYKGIVRQGNRVSQDTKAEFTATLYDANSQHVAEAEHRLNAYRSFSGSFNIPQNGLTGNFYIEVRDNYRVDFHVEEYKRPRFLAAFDTLKATYKVNDTVRLTGKATAYAGNVIDGATVKYRVVRTPRMIYTWRVRSWWNPSPPLEITHGETVTDATGMFHIDFEAIPDRSIDPKLDPVFDYQVYADITDGNGEARSAEMRVSVSYKSYVLVANVPGRAELVAFQNLSIRTENLAGVFAPADATVRIARIVPEKRLIRNRLWSKPDVFVMTQQEYIAHFPHDEYNNETEMETWPVAGEETEKRFTLKADGQVPISGYNLSPGFHKITITTSNAAGEMLTDVKFIELTAPNAKQLSQPQYLVGDPGKAAEPGEKGHYTLGTAVEKAFVISTSNRKSASSGFSLLTLNNEIRMFGFTAMEEDRGGFSIDYMFIKHNRLHSYTETVNVPWTNKDLKIEYGTFRDKTLPGSKETWKIRISGYKKEKVAAEMLASMYDASLDQFYHHQWMKPNFWPPRRGLPLWRDGGNFESANPHIRYSSIGGPKWVDKRYDELIWDNQIGNMLGGRQPGLAIRRRQMSESGKLSKAMPPAASILAPVMEAEELMDKSESDDFKDVVVVGYGVRKAPAAAQPDAASSAIRKNFNETAFFFPNLETDRDGNITFSFTLPEALTRWKFQALAHTPDLAVGYSSKEIVTQKELMVQPNAPRFLREGDRISFPVKVANLGTSAVEGDATLNLSDPETGASLDTAFHNAKPSARFSVAAGQSATVLFTLQIPKGFNKPVTWRAVAKAGNLSDGEENMLPVLPNRMLVTESLPLSMRGAGQKHFRFDKLKQSEKSPTLTHQSVTVEYSSNPAWYAVQSLPYLMEFPYECAEQTWNRFYANSLASHILNASPRIKQVFQSWAGTPAMQSNLAKNEALKSLLLQETPWVVQAQSEEAQKRNIALLFDLARMENEQSASMRKLQEMQTSNGGFAWFQGGRDDRYITQYIVTGIGHLQKLKALDASQQADIANILAKAIPYLDKRIEEDYKSLIASKADLKKYVPGPSELQYLYARSFFSKPVPDHARAAYQYYRERARLTWVSQSKFLQGLTALVCSRSQDMRTATQILASLRQTAVRNEELGMYWQTNQRGWWWHEAPIERQALMIEVFQEIDNDQATVADLKTWLLKNKQTNSWESTKATAEACYALLMQGSDWLAANPQAAIALGNTTISGNDQKTENGTGYFKKTITSDISAGMGDIVVSVNAAKNEQTGPSFGAVYWQYFEDLDKITFSETPLKVAKQLFIERNADAGPVLTPVHDGDAVKVGDKIRVRIELRVNRDMEYVHMKDMRASALEPVNVLSEHKWQGGLGYYESTRDASTNFFFSTLPKGTYVFEYPLFVTHEGDFSNGITTIQCMYAPEFAAHSEGVRLKALPQK